MLASERAITAALRFGCNSASNRQPVRHSSRPLARSTISYGTSNSYQSMDRRPDAHRCHRHSPQTMSHSARESRSLAWVFNALTESRASNSRQAARTYACTLAPAHTWLLPFWPCEGPADPAPMPPYLALRLNSAQIGGYCLCVRRGTLWTPGQEGISFCVPANLKPHLCRATVRHVGQKRHANARDRSCPATSTS